MGSSHRDGSAFLRSCVSMNRHPQAGQFAEIIRSSEKLGMFSVWYRYCISVLQTGHGPGTTVRTYSTPPILSREIFTELGVTTT